MSLSDLTSTLVLDSGVAVERPLAPAGWRGKRAFDVIGSLTLILVFLPLMLATALAVKVTSRGPVFFRQGRVGRDGREFGILKFRTMVVDSESRLAADPELYQRYLEGSHRLPCKVDPRVTRVGRVLRTWSIDELPQVFNVLAGHMSLVGPRPVTPEQLPEYEDLVDAYTSLRPGLTGMWQVSGRSEIVFPERAHLDADYRMACAPWLDVKVLARTPMAVVMRRGSD